MTITWFTYFWYICFDSQKQIYISCWAHNYQMASWLEYSHLLTHKNGPGLHGQQLCLQLRSANFNTPWNIKRLEAENHPFAKENHFQSFIIVFQLNFQGCTPCTLILSSQSGLLQKNLPVAWKSWNSRLANDKDLCIGHFKITRYTH